VKESIFSMLESRHRWEGVAVLDLFAGSGALGIEALSRGAAAAVFVESDRTAATAIRSNLATARVEGEILVAPAARAIKTLAAAGRRFGGVFLDPPYHRGWVDRTLVALEESGLIEAGGWVVVEHGREEEPASRGGTLAHRDTRRYGDTRVTIFHAAEAEECSDGVS
jgi:16S rRNA (guanine(966)-N(2))-methyltransferase RsmD